MNRLIIAATEDTPAIDFNCETKILRIEGNSYPENAREFYSPSIKWIRDFFSESSDGITFEFNLSYLSTSSTICILAILEILDNEYKKNNREICINWYFDDENESLKIIAQEFQEDISIVFNIIAFSSDDGKL